MKLWERIPLSVVVSLVESMLICVVAYAVIEVYC
jgi:hypothetical protein